MTSGCEVNRIAIQMLQWQDMPDASGVLRACSLRSAGMISSQAIDNDRAAQDDHLPPACVGSRPRHPGNRRKGHSRRGPLRCACKRLARKPPQCGADVAIAHFDHVLGSLELLEPSDEESAIAAELEYAAQQRGLPLDAGESLLAAIVVHRDLSCLATGDKRAIAALGGLRESTAVVQCLDGRLLCLEQLVLRMVETLGPTTVKAAVCSEAQADTALSICFSCGNPAVDPSNFTLGLQSYIGTLRQGAPELLGPSP